MESALCVLLVMIWALSGMLGYLAMRRRDKINQHRLYRPKPFINHPVKDFFYAMFVGPLALLIARVGFGNKI